MAPEGAAGGGGGRKVGLYSTPQTKESLKKRRQQMLIQEPPQRPGRIVQGAGAWKCEGSTRLKTSVDVLDIMWLKSQQNVSVRMEKILK